jgi:hypothetical protein
MVRRYGRAPRGQRVFVKQRRNYGKNMTLLAGLTLEPIHSSSREPSRLPFLRHLFSRSCSLLCNPVILSFWIIWLLINPAISNSSYLSTAAVFYSCQLIRQISRPLNRLFPRSNSACEHYVLRLLIPSSMLLMMPLPPLRHSMPLPSSPLLVFSTLTNSSTCSRTALVYKNCFGLLYHTAGFMRLL